MKMLLFLILLSLLLTSCGQADTLPTSTAKQDSTLTPSATATETPLPAVTPTPTLSPDPNVYECRENVKPEDYALVKEGVRIARYYLLKNFGSDVLEGIKFVIKNDPNDVTGEGSGAALRRPRHEEPYIKINTGHPWWEQYSGPEWQYNRIAAAVHELTHWWQVEHGCHDPVLADPLTNFLIEGQAVYAGRMATGKEELIDEARAASFWPIAQFNENKWFAVDGDVSFVAVKRLLDKDGTMAFTNFCDAVGQGTNPRDAFQPAFGVSIQVFRTKFMEDLLGQTKDCTVALCGYTAIGIYTMKDLSDPSNKTPNLVATFTDEKGGLVIIENFILCKQTINLPSTCREPGAIPGVFSASLLPGRYAFYFCEPGYPGTENPFKCKGRETDWFDISEKQITKITFQIPANIENADLPAPNLVVRFFDQDGNPLPDLFLQICNYDSAVKVCTVLNKKTDFQGIYQGFLRAGKFMLRFDWPTLNGDGLKHYEIDEINVSESSVTSISYRFPAPNLIVRFTDSVGGLLPSHEFVLCRAAQSAGNCLGSASLWGWRVGTNDEGVFEAHVRPGTYSIFTNEGPYSNDRHFDIEISDIVVKSEFELTTVEYQVFR